MKIETLIRKLQRDGQWTEAVLRDFAAAHAHETGEALFSTIAMLVTLDGALPEEGRARQQLSALVDAMASRLDDETRALVAEQQRAQAQATAREKDPTAVLPSPKKRAPLGVSMRKQSPKR